MPNTPDSENPFEAIDSAAIAAESISDNRSDEQRIAALEEQFAKIEPLLELLQNNNAMAISISNYVSDLRDEQRFFNRARYALALISIEVILFLMILLWESIWNSASPLLKSPAAAVAAFVIGIVSGVVFLITGFAKGVYRSTAERHGDGFLPPALEKVVEVYNTVKGGH